MVKDYQRLWRDVANGIDETKSVRILTQILVDKEGRAFISRLERRDAKLCIEILDSVSRDLHLSPFRHLRWSLSSGHHRARPQNSRETGFLRHIEEVGRNPWTTARFHDHHGND